MRTVRHHLVLLSILLAFAVGCAGGADRETVTIYCGRGESLVAPVVQAFEEETGIQVDIRYGGTADLAAQILEEGDQSPADVYYGQDAGALGQLASEGRLSPLPQSILDRVPARFRDPDGRWVGTTGRARVFVYNTELLAPEDLPDTIQGLTEARWKGRIGWSPTNGSFQAFVTALRLLEGEVAARQWLEGVLANDPVAYPNNTAIYQAVADGEVELALSNHYYLFRFLVQHGPEFPARTVSPRGGGAGGLINISAGGWWTPRPTRRPPSAFWRTCSRTRFRSDLREEPSNTRWCPESPPTRPSLRWLKSDRPTWNSETSTTCGERWICSARWAPSSHLL